MLRYILIMVIIVASYNKLSCSWQTFYWAGEDKYIIRVDTLNKIIFKNQEQQKFWEYYKSMSVCEKIIVFDSLIYIYQKELQVLTNNISLDSIRLQWYYPKSYSKDGFKLNIPSIFDTLDANFIFNESIKVQTKYYYNKIYTNEPQIVAVYPTVNTSIFYWLFLLIEKEIELDLIENMKSIPYRQAIFFNIQYILAIEPRLRKELIYNFLKYGECE